MINTNSAGGSRRYRALQLVHESTSTAEKKTVEGEADEEVLAEDEADAEERAADEGDPDDDEDGDAVEAREMTEDLARDAMDEDEVELVDGGEVMAVSGTAVAKCWICRSLLTCACLLISYQTKKLVRRPFGTSQRL